MKNPLVWIMAAVLSASLVACGGGTDLRSDIRTVTVGQELIDLQKAYDSGAISKKEYDKQREKILRRK